MKTFVIGDIHGGLKSLKQCLERSNFDYQNDKLICLGDVADGWSETFECFEELFKIKNLVYIIGNHDQWLIDWLDKGDKPEIWTSQGGNNTLESYLKENPKDWKRHLDFLSSKPFYYIDEENRCFVHGGVPQKGEPLEECDDIFLSWDRELWNNRNNLEDIKEFKTVIVGHTSIYTYSHYPKNYANVWFMDTGGGMEGVLTIMNIDTMKFFQSDVVSGLYKDIRGRN